MKTLLLPFLISWAFAATAVKPIDHISCLDQVTRAIEAVGTPVKWHNISQGRASRIPGFGHVEIYPLGTKTRLVMSDAKNIKTFILTSPKCDAEVATPVANDHRFRDIDLAELYVEKPRGLIYIWSPHMSLSVQELETIPTMNLKEPVTILMDAEADEALAKKIVAEKKWPATYLRRVGSAELFKADITIHYPAVIFYRNGKILKRIPGYNGVALKPMVEKAFQ